MDGIDRHLKVESTANISKKLPLLVVFHHTRAICCESWALAVKQLIYF